MIWTNFFATVFLSGAVSVLLCILHSPQRDCSAVIGKEGVTGRENQALVGALAVLCVLLRSALWSRRQRAAAFRFPIQPSDCLQKKKRMWISFHEVSPVCAWHASQPLSLSMQWFGFFLDMKHLQFLPNTLLLILHAQAVEIKVRCFFVA